MYTHGFVIVDALLTIEIEGVFRCEASMLGIEIREVNIRRSHERHTTTLGIAGASDEGADNARQNHDTQQSCNEGQPRY